MFFYKSDLKVCNFHVEAFYSIKYKITKKQNDVIFIFVLETLTLYMKFLHELSLIRSLTFITILASCSNRTYTEIPLEQVEAFFGNMKAKGVNTDTTMLYGYFFTNETKLPLERAAEELKDKGFQFVEIHQSDDKIFWLQVQRKEIHNGQSLYSLNKELYKLADSYNLQSYDGYDVGNVDPTKAIVTDTYIVHEEFSVKDFLKDGYPFILIINDAFDRFSHKEEFCYFIKITCNYPIVDERKLPNGAELETFDKLEQTIEEVLKAQNVKNYYVFRSTHMGERNFFIATNNMEAANKTMKKFQKTSKIFPFKYEIIKDEKWTIYGLAKKPKVQP